jgi:LemA protein
MRKWIGIGIAVLVVLVLAGSTIGSYNSLVAQAEAVDGQWGQVQNVYQRRADLVPNLVNTVRGAANFERETLQAVTEARSRVGQISPEALRNATNDPQALARFESAQGELSSALSRLLVVSERYPELRATANFRDLQSQLEGTENRIAVERMRFNEAARKFNTTRNSFPTVLFAGMFGSRFAEKAYFEAAPASQSAPRVEF